MKVVTSLEELEPVSTPAVLTIGYFDGVHLGHQAVIQRVREIAKQQSQISALLTFSNHPSTVLSPNQPTEDLCSCEEKVALIESLGIDLLILLNFDRALSQQSAEEFLSSVQSRLLFSHLILGYDAHFGNQRRGDPETIRKYALEKGFIVEYVPSKMIGDTIISSSAIRKLFQEGKKKEAAKFLGRAAPSTETFKH